MCRIILWYRMNTMNRSNNNWKCDKWFSCLGNCFNANSVCRGLRAERWRMSVWIKWSNNSNKFNIFMHILFQNTIILMIWSHSNVSMIVSINDCRVYNVHNHSLSAIFITCKYCYLHSLLNPFKTLLRLLKNFNCWIYWIVAESRDRLRWQRQAVNKRITIYVVVASIMYKMSTKMPFYANIDFNAKSIPLLKEDDRFDTSRTRKKTCCLPSVVAKNFLTTERKNK